MYKAIATAVTAVIIGCSSLGGGSCKANIATVIQTPYDMVSPERDSPVAVGDQVGRQAKRGAFPKQKSQAPAQNVAATTSRQICREGKKKRGIYAASKCLIE